MLYVIYGAALLLLDQCAKAWTAKTFAIPVLPAVATADPPREFLPGILELTRVHNYGAAWSSFSGMRWVLVAVTGAIMAAVAALVIRKVIRHPLGLTACTLVLSGGIGNILDRVRLGYVVDMLNFQFMRFPVFNVADICVVTGAILGAVYYLWFYEKYDRRRNG